MKSFKISTYNIASTRLTGKQKVTFAILADLHGLVFGKNHQTLYKAIIASQPDAVLVCGDLVTETLSGLVVENQVLKVQLLDFVSNKDFDDKYQEVSMDIKADEEVLNYKISNRQVFNKVMQLLPPGEGSPLLNNSSEVPTHEAYILVLTGDIVEYKDSEGKSSYQIANARLDYYKQSLLLENDYDSVYIASIDGKKEKMVKITVYKEALSSPSEYMTMLQW